MQESNSWFKLVRIIILKLGRDMLAEIVEELAPTGVLRAAINMSNFLLVTGKTEDGDPVGVSPDMAGELAKRLGVGLELLKYKTPGEVADDAGKGIWDIGNIGAEPQRAEKIDFTAAYCEIQATYSSPASHGMHAWKRQSCFISQEVC